jgi:hypothetical protein
MSNILTIGYITEGTTDVRFLDNIIERTFSEAAMGCKGVIEVYTPQHIPSQGKTFKEKVLQAARIANQQGLMVLCVHTDADDSSDEKARTARILPSFEAVLETEEENICKNLLAIVPIQMTEAWLLTDEEALLDAMMSTQPLRELGIEYAPERYSNPKAKIEEAIRYAHQNRPKRHRQQILISDLYGPIGQQCDLKKLRRLHSFQKFEEEVKGSLKTLNYL